jgi:hypothetical protein
VRRYFLSLATDEELDVMVGLAARIRDQRANLADQKN